MSIEIRGMNSSEIIKLIPDEFYARKSVVDYWNTCQKQGRRIIGIHLWKNLRIIDAYLGDGNWSKGKKSATQDDDDCDF